MGLLKTVKNLFTSKRTLLCTAIGDDECIRMLGNLDEAGISHVTKIRGVYAGSGKRSLAFSTKLSQYDIYVEKEDEYKAYEAIHQIGH